MLYVIDANLHFKKVYSYSSLKEIKKKNRWLTYEYETSSFSSFSFDSKEHIDIPQKLNEYLCIDDFTYHLFLYFFFLI